MAARVFSDSELFCPRSVVRSRTSSSSSKLSCCKTINLSRTSSRESAFRVSRTHYDKKGIHLSTSWQPLASTHPGLNLMSVPCSAYNVRSHGIKHKTGNGIFHTEKLSIKYTVDVCNCLKRTFCRSAVVVIALPTVAKWLLEESPHISLLSASVSEEVSSQTTSL